MQKLYKFLTNHKALTISWLTALQLLIYAYGCQPKCQSILNPTVRITASEFNAEIQMLQAKVKDRQLSLEQQSKLRDVLFGAAITAAQAGTVNPVSIAIALAAVLGIGAGVEGQVEKSKAKKTLALNISETNKLKSESG